MPDDMTIVNDIETHLPYLRRYARALTGSQKHGDALAASTLQAILLDMTLMDTVGRPAVRLFSVFHTTWMAQGRLGTSVEDGAMANERIAAARLEKLTPSAREALLLKVMEQFTIEEVGEIMSTSTQKADELVRIGAAELEGGLASRILVVEDEPLIAMDLEAIVSDLGHTVVGNARTHSEAIAMYAQHKPELVLMDVHLADGSSGAEAATEILEETTDQPIIFITAYPERLLTGQQAEPAFLITKPFTEEQVRATVSQALFFSARTVPA